MRDNYGVGGTPVYDPGPEAQGADLMTITHFSTAMGVRGIAAHGPNGRYTVLPSKAGGYDVHESATVRRIGTYSNQGKALSVACKRAGAAIEDYVASVLRGGADS